MASEVPTAKDFVARYINKEEDERMKLVEEAKEKLSNTQMRIFKKEVKKIEDEEKAAVSSAEEDTPAGTTADKGKATEEFTKKVIAVTEADVISFWSDLESMSGEDLINDQVILDFQYVGFDPNVIMKSIIQKGREAKKSKKEILSDIADMCVIAVLKGSVTETNLKKMSDSGKVKYGKLQATYALKTGGSKGVDPTTITVARAGAAFPGSMMKILAKKTELAKKFSGVFGSKVLPYYLRHQCAAACVPEDLESRTKDFILGIITAFTSDQSKIISKKRDLKKTPLEIFEDQENFVATTHGSHYPTREVRLRLFKEWSLVADYPKMVTVANAIIKINKTFEIVPLDDLKEDIAKL